MIDISTVRGIDSDRVDGGRRPWRPVVVALIGGLVVGGLLGGTYGASRPKTFQATTSLSVLPDSSVSAAVPGATTGQPAQDATSFIQSQLVVLNGAPLREQVDKQLKSSRPPQLSSTQVAQTYVVQVSATATSRAEALAAAQAASAAYAAMRRQQLGGDVAAAIRSVQKQVVSARNGLEGSTIGAGSGIAPQSSALRDEYQRLLAVSSSLELSQGQVGRAVTTVIPANIVAAGSLSSTTKNAAAGALAGALLALAALALVRRNNPRIRSVADLAALDLPILLPALPRTRRGSAATRRTHEGRLLASRLGSSAVHRPLVVLGATSGVGASYVATTLALHLSERAPVLLVVLSAHGHDRPLLDAKVPSALEDSLTSDGAAVLNRAVGSQVPGVAVLPLTYDGPQSARQLRALIESGLLDAASHDGWLVVVDAPALDESDLGLDCARAAGAATLVAGRTRSRPADLLGAAELLDAEGPLLSGVIVNDAPARWSVRLPRRGRSEDGQPVLDKPEPVLSPVAVGRSDSESRAPGPDAPREPAAVVQKTRRARAAKPAIRKPRATKPEPVGQDAVDVGVHPSAEPLPEHPISQEPEPDLEAPAVGAAADEPLPAISRDDGQLYDVDSDKPADAAEAPTEPSSRLVQEPPADDAARGDVLDAKDSALDTPSRGEPRPAR